MSPHDKLDKLTEIVRHFNDRDFWTASSGQLAVDMANMQRAQMYLLLYIAERLTEGEDTA